MNKLSNFYKLKPGVWVLMICFLLLPFISWLYIRNGVEFRLKALKELNQRIDISVIDPVVVNDKLINHDSLLGRVWVFINSDKLTNIEESKTLVQTLYDQNDGSRAVRIVICGKGDQRNTYKLSPILTKRNFVMFASDTVYEALSKIFVLKDSLSISKTTVNGLIIDNKGFMRRGYDLTKESEVKQLVQHSAVLIPEYKREKPQLVRQDGY